jgi:predicted kinase
MGLPASGKTSFYRERFAATHDHVSKDLMRNNRRPERRQQQLITAILAQGRSVVVDNTNPTAADRASLIATARQFGVDVVGYLFVTEAADALRRNRARQGRDRVPDVAIFTTRKRFTAPTLGEGFSRLYQVRLVEPEGRFEITPLGETDAPLP